MLDPFHLRTPTPLVLATVGVSMTAEALNDFSKRLQHTEQTIGAAATQDVLRGRLPCRWARRRSTPLAPTAKLS